MQNVESNLDELFRRAAANYSLRDSGEEWQRIAPELLHVVSPATTVQKSLQVRKYSTFSFFSFFFIFVAGIATTDIYYSGSKRSGNINSANEKLDDVSTEERGKRRYRGEIKGRSIFTKQLLVDQEYNTSGKLRGFKAAFDFREGKNEHTQIVTPDVVLAENQVPAVDSKSGKKMVAEATAGSQAELVDTTAEEHSAEMIMPGQKDSSVSDTTARPTAVQKAVDKNKYGVYLGGVFGPSFNQVKSQGLRRPGFDIGLLLGYQLNKSLSFETGVLFEKKYYFTDGKYFDITKASSGMPAGMKVVSLEGSCSIIEVPFKVKYNLLHKGYKHFYVTTGISGYVVTGEYNKYHAILNGTEQDITGSYNKSSSYTAAVLVLGAGYENRVSKSFLVRISPYVQIPLRGIGVGSLPVMSAGLHFGFSRFLK